MQNYPDAVAIRAGAVHESIETGVTTRSFDIMVDGYALVVGIRFTINRGRQ
jgi:hypothetical protein